MFGTSRHDDDGDKVLSQCDETIKTGSLSRVMVARDRVSFLESCLQKRKKK
jgi:hypothetical protein